MNLSELLYKVKTIMNTKFIIVRETDTIEYVSNLMINNNSDEVIITDSDEQLKGIFTRNDLAKCTSKNRSMKVTIDKCMIKNPITISPEQSAKYARDLMIKNNIGRIPVVEGKKVIGVLTSNNIRDTFYLKVDEMFDLQNNILDNIHEAVCICDPKGNIIYWNKSSEKLYKLKAKEVVGKNLKNYFNDAKILTVLKEGRVIENIRHEPIKGKSVILSVVPIYNSENKLVAVVSTDRDITEVVNLSEKLKSANAKVEFLSKAYSREIANNYKFSHIIGNSKKIIDSIALCQKVASTTASILITGESGTGKEVFAKAIHEASGRKGEFVAVNCSAIPEALLESELFGYVEGAFTGAVKKGKIGMFEFADNGTLFLDEIGDMPVGMQSKLLRVLQDGIIYRLGSEKGIKTNTRIIAATNKNLRKAIKEREFRDDLFYRLAVVQVELPPLRERKDDIKDLINYFVNQLSKCENIIINGIDSSIYNILSHYKWEGNIRELRNVIQRMIVLSNEGYVSRASIPSYIIKANDNMDLNNCNEEIIDEFDLEERVKELEYKTIKKVMEITKGNKVKAAEMLKIKRSTLYYKLKQYNIEHTCQ